MTKDLDTLLSALYVVIDDHVVVRRAGRGRQPLLSDSELITLAVAQILQRYPSQRRWIRHIRGSAQWRTMFPYLPTQSGYHKRLINASPLLCRAILTMVSVLSVVVRRPVDDRRHPAALRDVAGGFVRVVRPRMFISGDRAPDLAGSDVGEFRPHPAFPGRDRIAVVEERRQLAGAPVTRPWHS